VADARVDPPHGEWSRKRDRPDDLGRAAEEQQQVPALAVRGRHLIHRAARGTGEQLLGLLADQGEPPRIRGVAKTGRDRLQHGHSDRGRGGEPLALRDVGGNHHTKPTGGCPLLPQEQGDRPEHVSTPGRRPGETGRELGERLIDQRGDLEHHP
jgi:hypothetical protein